MASDLSKPAFGPRWGFVGAGKMASAMIRGMIQSGAVPAGHIAAFDPVPAAVASLAELGIAAKSSNADVVRGCDVLVLAVKPQSMPAVLGELEPLVTENHLVVSIAAGIPLSVLAAGLGPAPRLIRVMPNTPSLVGAGASAFCLGKQATADDEAIVRACLEATGKAIRVPETLMDAVTALSGSGPAFVYVMIEALSDAGVRAGLPRDAATTLAAQTVLGAAKMVLETGMHPGALKDEVTSPGGTTIAGLHALEKAGVRAGLMDAVEASRRRSVEMAETAARAWK